jgi:hypothetical protein
VAFRIDRQEILRPQASLNQPAIPDLLCMGVRISSDTEKSLDPRLHLPRRGDRHCSIGLSVNDKECGDITTPITQPLGTSPGLGSVTQDVSDLQFCRDTGASD